MKFLDYKVGIPLVLFTIFLSVVVYICDKTLLADEPRKEKNYVTIGYPGGTRFDYEGITKWDSWDTGAWFELDDGRKITTNGPYVVFEYDNAKKTTKN